MAPCLPTAQKAANRPIAAPKRKGRGQVLQTTMATNLLRPGNDFVRHAKAHGVGAHNPNAAALGVGPKAACGLAHPLGRGATPQMPECAFGAGAGGGCPQSP